MPKRGENIRKRKDGRWEGRYRKSTGNVSYGSVYGKSYNEVKQKLKEIGQKQILKIGMPGKERKFKEVLLLWKDANRIKHKGATETKYEYLMDKHIIPVLGDYNLSAITPFVLNDFMEQKLNNGNLKDKSALSQTYVRSMMIIILSALQYAVNEQMCLSFATPIFKPTAEKKELKILSEKEYEKLENYLCNNLNETNLGIIISLYSGLRIGEICALKWEDIDLENKILYVKSTIARVRNEKTGGTVLILDKPKTKASVRKIPIHSNLLNLLKKAIAISSSPFVISTNSQFVNPRTYEYRFHREFERCGIDPINYHALRHTFATRCISKGMDVKTLSEILGHANVSITLNTYVHSSMEMKLQQIEKITA